MDTIINEFTLTDELCINYTRNHLFKKLKIFLNIASVGLLISLLQLIYLNCKYDVKNFYGIILTLISLIVTLLKQKQTIII